MKEGILTIRLQWATLEEKLQSTLTNAGSVGLEMARLNSSIAEK